MADPCTQLESQLNALEKELASIISSWGDDFETGGQKSAIVKQHQQETAAVKAKIAAKKAQFENCLKSLPRVPLTASVSGLNCIEETSDAGASDEPYVLVCAVDLKSTTPITIGGTTASVPIPREDVRLIGPWTGVDSGDYVKASALPAQHRRPFWNLQGNAARIANPDDVIFLVGFMENDDADPDGVRSAVRATMAGNLVEEPTTSRATLVANLREAFDGALVGAHPVGVSFPFNTDEVIGKAQELRLTSLDLGWVAHKGTTSKSLNFAGDGGRYRVDFTLAKG